MKTVLLCEDDENLRETLKLSLSREFKVHLAPDGETAVKACKELKPDVLLIDFSLPDIDANEVCNRIEADPECVKPKVIVMTGQSQSAGEVNYQATYEKAFQVDAYFNKPVHTETLIQRIKQLY